VIVGGGQIVLNGDYRVQGYNSGSYTFSSGKLIMTNTEDCILVKGDFVTDSIYDHSANLTNGVLEVEGSFTQKSSHPKTKYQPIAI